MANVLIRRSLFETDIDPDAIKIEIFADEQLYGSLILSSEDLRMLVKINRLNQSLIEFSSDHLGFTYSTQSHFFSFLHVRRSSSRRRFPSIRSTIKSVVSIMDFSSSTDIFHIE